MSIKLEHAYYRDTGPLELSLIHSKLTVALEVNMYDHNWQHNRDWPSSSLYR